MYILAAKAAEFNVNVAGYKGYLNKRFFNQRKVPEMIDNIVAESTASVW